MDWNQYSNQKQIKLIGSSELSNFCLDNGTLEIDVQTTYKLILSATDSPNHFACNTQHNQYLNNIYGKLFIWSYKLKHIEEINANLNWREGPKIVPYNVNEPNPKVVKRALNSAALSQQQGQSIH